MKNKLLIIEDETKIREIVCDYFNEKGFETTGASNGPELMIVKNHLNIHNADYGCGNTDTGVRFFFVI